MATKMNTVRNLDIWINLCMIAAWIMLVYRLFEYQPLHTLIATVTHGLLLACFVLLGIKFIRKKDTINGILMFSAAGFMLIGEIFGI